MGAEVKSMDIKKSQQAVSARRERSLSAKRAQDFVTDVRSEIQKITWTNREELIAYTKIVVLMTFICGMGIYLLDLSIQAALAGLNFFLHLIS